jgi:hypothetical protein
MAFDLSFFANDHSPPHAHVFGRGGEAKILLEEQQSASLEWFVGLSRADARFVLSEVQSVREQLLLAWRRLHE